MAESERNMFTTKTLGSYQQGAEAFLKILGKVFKRDRYITSHSVSAVGVFRRTHPTFFYSL